MSFETDIQRLTERSSTPAASVEHAMRFNLRNWEELMRADPQLTRLEIGIAHCARIMLTSEQSSLFYAEARTQDRRLRERRYELLEQRAGAKP